MYGKPGNFCPSLLHLSACMFADVENPKYSSHDRQVSLDVRCSLFPWRESPDEADDAWNGRARSGVAVTSDPDSRFLIDARAFVALGESGNGSLDLPVLFMNFDRGPRTVVRIGLQHRD
jgi:hypothetical protein